MKKPHMRARGQVKGAVSDINYDLFLYKLQVRYDRIYQFSPCSGSHLNEISVCEKTFPDQSLRENYGIHRLLEVLGGYQQEAKAGFC